MYSCPQKTRVSAGSLAATPCRALDTAKESTRGTRGADKRKLSLSRKKDLRDVARQLQRHVVETPTKQVLYAPRGATSTIANEKKTPHRVEVIAIALSTTSNPMYTSEKPDTPKTTQPRPPRKRPKTRQIPFRRAYFAPRHPQRIARSRRQTGCPLRTQAAPPLPLPRPLPLRSSV